MQKIRKPQSQKVNYILKIVLMLCRLSQSLKLLLCLKSNLKVPLKLDCETNG